MNKVYRLPNGKYTSNADKYIKAWREIAKPIETLFFVGKDGKSISLPVWFVERFNNIRQNYCAVLNSTSGCV